MSSGRAKADPLWGSCSNDDDEGCLRDHRNHWVVYHDRGCDAHGFERI